MYHSLGEPPLVGGKNRQVEAAEDMTVRVPGKDDLTPSPHPRATTRPPKGNASLAETHEKPRSLDAPDGHSCTVGRRPRAPHVGPASTTCTHPLTGGNASGRLRRAPRRPTWDAATMRPPSLTGWNAKEASHVVDRGVPRGTRPRQEPQREPVARWTGRHRGPSAPRGTRARRGTRGGRSLAGTGRRIARHCTLRPTWEAPRRRRVASTASPQRLTATRRTPWTERPTWDSPARTWRAAISSNAPEVLPRSPSPAGRPGGTRRGPRGSPLRSAR